MSDMTQEEVDSRISVLTDEIRIREELLHKLNADDAYMSVWAKCLKKMHRALCQEDFTSAQATEIITHNAPNILPRNE